MFDVLRKGVRAETMTPLFQPDRSSWNVDDAWTATNALGMGDQSNNESLTPILG